jgi:hypothetical protein
MCEVRLELDTTRVEEQLQELRGLLKLQSPESLPHDLLCMLERLGSDVVIGKDVSAVNTGGGKKIVVFCSLGRAYGDLFAALRADEWDSVAHVSTRLQ